MPNRQTRILDSGDIAQKIQRMAYQIAEENCNETEMHFIGVHPTGYELAKQLKDAVAKITGAKISIAELILNKKHPLSEDVLLSAKTNYTGKCVVLIDDVANTGRTMYYALKPLLAYDVRKIQVAVLVDRRHKSFPVAADFVGLSLATTLKEHIRVSLQKDEEGVFLS